MQNVTGKTTIKKNSKKIVNDIFFSRLFVVTLRAVVSKGRTLRYEGLEKPLLAG